MRLALAALAIPAVLAATEARASEIAPDGKLVFAADALATCGFESLAALEASGAARIPWAAGGSLATSPIGAGDEAKLLSGAADALEGGHALVVRSDDGRGIVLREPALAAAAHRRVSVSMWGRAHGAEPVLEVVYAPSASTLGPALVRITAVRTGRETSDGWVEYATGPVDGTALEAPLRAIVLSALYATEAGSAVLARDALDPGAELGDGQGAPSVPVHPAKPLDPTAYALIDAVEVRPEPGAATPASATCTQATVDEACGVSGECVFGHCVDAAAVWGPVPQAADHRADLVARWAFVARHLHADRRATAAAAGRFRGAATRLAALTSPRGYYGGLNQLVNGMRDSHTTLGAPPSGGTVTFPVPDAGSGPLDVCVGLARNDLAGDAPGFAVYAVGKNPSIREKLQTGDVLTAVDGLSPDAWIAAVLPRFVARQPGDPGADPSQTSLVLAKLLGRFARTVTFSRCQPGGGCQALPDIPVADQVYARVSAGLAYAGNSLRCTVRFHPAVKSPPPDLALVDTVVTETEGPLARVQFDGFSGLFSKQNGWHAWEDPWTRAFEGNQQVLVDARIGHGGKFTLGKWLFHYLRGTGQPYGVFAMPRGAWDDPDPPWLFEPRWDACVNGEGVLDGCDWAGGQSTFTKDAAPAGEAARIAWVDGNDVSMNDIVPRLLAGRAGFRLFGPHPSHGAYGEVSAVPPIEPPWGRGTIQVLDMRFGETPAAARAAPWESGKGVIPDQVVVQKVSDLLADVDTVLAAATAWVSP